MKRKTIIETPEKTPHFEVSGIRRINMKKCSAVFAVLVLLIVILVVPIPSAHAIEIEPLSDNGSLELIKQSIADLPFGGEIILKEGEWDIGVGFTVPSNISIKGTGSTTVLKVGDMPQSSLSGNAVLGQNIVTVDDAAGFAQGLCVMLYSLTKYGFYVIDSIDGNDIHLTTNLKANYAVVDNAGIVGHSYPAIAIEGTNVELSNFLLDGNRGNRSGGIQYLYNGSFDSSNEYGEGAGYKDGAICIGHKVSVDNVKIHDLIIKNTSSDGIRGQATDGIHHGKIYVYSNQFVNIGDKAILFRSATTNPGSIDYVGIEHNYIDGTGKAEQNDRSEGKFSWGDGIQGHTYSPTSMDIRFNAIADTARSGIWIMASNNTTGALRIEGNDITEWGQKVFGNENQINVSAIYANRPAYIISNRMDGGFTSGNPRQDSCYGVNVVAITCDTDTLVTQNSVKNFWSIHNTPAYMMKQITNSRIVDNFAEEGKLGIYLLQMKNVIVSDNLHPNLDLTIGNAQMFHSRITDNIWRNLIVSTGSYYDLLVQDNTKSTGPAPGYYYNQLGTLSYLPALTLLGDVNGDGKVNAVDITALERLIAGLK